MMVQTERFSKVMGYLRLPSTNVTHSHRLSEGCDKRFTQPSHNLLTTFAQPHLSN